LPESGTRILICFLLAATASMSVAADFSGNKGFSAAVGGEYQYITQQYYSSILDTTTVDVLEVWQLAQDEINDFILKTDLRYDLQNSDHRLNLLADFQLSNDRRLGRTEAYYRFGEYDNNLKVSGKFESKAPTSDDDYRIEEYNYFETWLGGRKRLNRSFSLNFKTGYESISFADQPTDSAESLAVTPIFSYFDYSMFSGWIGGDLAISEFGRELSWRLGYRRRHVPDSTLAGYNQTRVEVEYIDFGPRLNISLNGDFEARDYFQPDGRDDFWAFNFRGSLSHTVGRHYEIGGNIQTDLYRYSVPDIINRNYTLYRGEVNGTMRLDGFGWGPLLRLEYRNEEAGLDEDLGAFSETYSQWEMGLQADFLNRRAIFFNGEVTYGRRSYSQGESFLSSYNIWSVALLANYSPFKNLSFNLMLDGSFESHDSQSDDTDLLLLSFGVTARI
jgi:hypothetical protein